MCHADVCYMVTPSLTDGDEAKPRSPRVSLQLSTSLTLSIGLQNEQGSKIC